MPATFAVRSVLLGAQAANTGRPKAASNQSFASTPTMPAGNDARNRSPMQAAQEIMLYLLREGYIDSSDRIRQFNNMFTVGVIFALPPKIKTTD